LFADFFGGLVEELGAAEAFLGVGDECGARMTGGVEFRHCLV
jgi:hypothetical protein